jgi:hypothetical protein
MMLSFRGNRTAVDGWLIGDGGREKGDPNHPAFDEQHRRVFSS